MKRIETSWWWMAKRILGVRKGQSLGADIYSKKQVVMKDLGATFPGRRLEKRIQDSRSLMPSRNGDKSSVSRKEVSSHGSSGGASSEVGRPAGGVGPGEMNQEGRGQKRVVFLLQLSIAKSIKSFQATLRFFSNYLWWDAWVA